MSRSIGLSGTGLSGAGRSDAGPSAAATVQQDA